MTLDLQREHHRHADGEHFAWQTTAPYISPSEASLVAGTRLSDGETLLEIGCGEGGNLYHLRSLPGQRFGVDFSPAKAAFAARATDARIACADALRLPFVDGCFDAVLIRDLLHHLPNRPSALEEAHRVLKPGGRLTLVEPNGWAPLVWVQAVLIRAERGLFRSTASRIARELADAGFRVVTSRTEQPFPLARVILHPRFGSPQLTRSPLVLRSLAQVDAVARRLVPERAWLYLVFDARKE